MTDRGGVRDNEVRELGGRTEQLRARLWTAAPCVILALPAWNWYSGRRRNRGWMAHNWIVCTPRTRTPARCRRGRAAARTGPQSGSSRPRSAGSSVCGRNGRTKWTALAHRPPKNQRWSRTDARSCPPTAECLARATPAESGSVWTMRVVDASAWANNAALRRLVWLRVRNARRPDQPVNTRLPSTAATWIRGACVGLSRAPIVRYLWNICFSMKILWNQSFWRMSKVDKAEKLTSAL